MDSRDVIQLLVEIRDLQREHLAEYRRVTAESLDLSRRAVARQEQIGALYQRVVAVSVVMFGVLVVALLWLVGLLR